MPIEQENEKRLANHMPVNCAEFIKAMTGFLSDDDQRLFGEDMSVSIGQRLSSLSILAAEAPIDYESFQTCCAHDLSNEQAKRLLSIALEAGLLYKEPARVNYNVLGVFLFDPNRPRYKFLDRDEELFGQEAKATIAKKLESLKTLARGDYDFPAILEAFGSDLSFDQATRLCEIAQKELIFQMREIRECYKMPIDVCSSLGGYLGEMGKDE